MPHHFAWRELDWSGGLWTLNAMNHPAGTAQQLLDCYPTPGSRGLKAGPRFTERPNTGIGVGEKPIGYFARGGIPLRSGAAGEGTDYYLVTWNGSAPKLYRWDDSDDVAPYTSWALLKTFAASTGVGNAVMVPFALSGTPPTTHVYLMLDYTGSETGLWRIRYSDGNVARPAHGLATPPAPFANPIVVHQSRLVVNESQSADRSTIWWTEPGSETIASDSFLDVDPAARLTGAHFFGAFAPDNLLIAKGGAAWHLVQDDIEDPIVRAMNDVRHTADKQVPAALDPGLAFQVWRDGIYVTPDGSQFTKVSDRLSQDSLFGGNVRRLPGLGSMAYLDAFLFHPSGLIFDTRTQAWFRTSRWSTSIPALWMSVDKHVDHHELHVAQDPVDGSSPPRLWLLELLESGMDRSRTFQARTAPLRDPTGRQVVVRGVEVYLDVTSPGASVTLTVNNALAGGAGQPQTISGIGAGRQKIEFQCLAYNEVVDVQLDVDSGGALVEAPEVEVVRLGTLAGHLTPSGA